MIFFFLTIFPLRLFAQTIFKFGPEIGISVTSKNQEKLSFLYFDNSLHFISPLLGIKGSVEVFHWLNIKTGIQYEKAGYPTEKPKDDESGIKFSKICIPLKFEIPFKIKKVNNSVFVGYRPNLLLSGKYSYWGKDVNLFSMEYPVKRYTGQITTGLSVYSGNSNISLSYFGCSHIDFALPYTFIHHYGQIETRYSNCSLKNNELVLSFTYLFSSKKE
jgi:hypothetical protein